MNVSKVLYYKRFFPLRKMRAEKTGHCKRPAID